MNGSELIFRSEYILMRDAVRLAISFWLPKHWDNKLKRGKGPAVLITTRYWRAMAFKQDNLNFQTFYPYASHLCAEGYAFVVADARGSGASF